MSTIPRERAYDMFLVGEAYCNAGKSLYSQFGMGGSSHFKYVIAANFALGLELYFKCLLVMDDKDPQYHHNLKGHFDKLSPVDQLRDSGWPTKNIWESIGTLGKPKSEETDRTQAKYSTLTTR